MALFSRDHITRLLAGLPPDALVSIIGMLNTFWSENLRRFTILLNLPFWDRLTMVMSDLAKRAGVRDSEGIMLIPEIGHEDLAEMIGCSRPMVSRLIAIMAESGVLARRGKQYVLLKKWDFNNNHQNSQKQIRQPEVTFPRKSSTSVGSSNGSGSSRGIAAYAARSSG
jgi:CRP-like cAMP-binding protein